MRSALIGFLIILFTDSLAQKQNNVWCFGFGAMVDFNSGIPAGSGTSSIMQHEGTASICDKNGLLLFYTDGIKVWNRSHNQMPNGFGLLGGWSTTQSALIVPLPGSSNIYYIFTLPHEDNIIGNDPFCYSIVDMNLNGSMGDITIKNTPIFLPPMTEKLTATLKDNGVDYWIITRRANPDQRFLSYSFTSAGLDLNPVVSQVAFLASESISLGYAKVTPDGSKLVAVNSMVPRLVQLYDFNKTTGVVSNPIHLVYPNSNSNSPYGAEFSPDNSKLYILTDQSSALWQYDLLAGSPAAIQNSATLIFIGPNPQYNGGALLRGPDNKIYVAHYQRLFISVINQPDLAGAACNFVNNAVPLTGTCRLSLPNNINYPVCPATINTSSDVTICPGQSYQMPSGTMVNTTGTFSDTIRTSIGCDSLTTTINLSFIAPLNATISKQICSNETYQLPSGTHVNIPGVYFDTIKNVNGCDSMIITVDLQVQNISTTVLLDSMYEGQPYLLPWGQTITSPGVYQHTLTNSAGCDSIITLTVKTKMHLSECLSLRNAFTPNGDGLNDHWILSRYFCFKKMEVDVFNRYGTLVYHSADYRNNWNGTYNNAPLPDGTYYYVIKVLAFDDRQQYFKGNVSILR